jgi:RES domain-containing protein
MEVYRLAREKFAALSAKGSAIKGARWNSAGVEIIYTSAYRSLAMAEVAVHFSMATLPADYVIMSIYIPDNISLQNLHASDLPPDWNAFPPPITIQSIGDKFVSDNIFCVLQIPSSVTQGDDNLLINPNHREFKKIQITSTIKFPFDKRIFN